MANKANSPFLFPSLLRKGGKGLVRAGNKN